MPKDLTKEELNNAGVRKQEEGDTACRDLSYEEGEALYKEALDYYIKAASKGSESGMYNAGLAFWACRGVGTTHKTTHEEHEAFLTTAGNYFFAAVKKNGINRDLALHQLKQMASQYQTGDWVKSSLNAISHLVTCFDEKYVAQEAISQQEIAEYRAILAKHSPKMSDGDAKKAQERVMARENAAIRKFSADGIYLWSQDKGRPVLETELADCKDYKRPARRK